MAVIDIEGFGDSRVSAGDISYWCDEHEVNDPGALALLSSFAEQLLSLAQTTSKSPVTTERHLACLVHASEALTRASENVFNNYPQQDRQPALATVLATNVLKENQIPVTIFEQLCLLSLSTGNDLFGDAEMYIRSVGS